MATLKAKDFKPDRDRFFSKNLYKWLKKNPYYNKIYRATWNQIGGYDPDNPVIMIGVKTNDRVTRFHGNLLRRVCSGDRMDAGRFAYIHEEMRIDEWEDITEQFIEDYKRIGVCAIHGEYAHRFDVIGKKEKKCLNCGAVYKRKSKRVTKHYWEQQQ